ncbi:MAG: hypothetical protein J0H57_20860, partial [Rhodospirillales bacterium]|nr:hypothetical protein [Rhodospirillales bacterium]
DVTTVVYNNAAYAILRGELLAVGASAPAGAGSRSRSLLDIGGPRLDFVALATGMGVPAERVATAEALAAALTRAGREPGPHLIEAMVPPVPMNATFGLAIRRRPSHGRPEGRSPCRCP